MTHPSYRGRAGLALAVLCLLAAAVAVLLGYSFAPGGMNPDAVHQLRQVLGDEPVGDWHPPVLVVVWKVLMLLSGEISALMWAQIGLWAACAIGLGIYLYDLTARIPVMFLGLGVLLLPHVVALVGDV